MKFIKEKDEEQSDETIRKKRKIYAIGAIVLTLLVGISVVSTVFFYKNDISSGSKNAKVDNHEVPMIRFDGYANCSNSTHSKFKYIQNGRGNTGNIGIRSAYWKKNFTIDIKVSSKYPNKTTLKSSDIVLGPKLSLVSVNFVSNYTEKTLYVSKYRITLKSKIISSLNGYFTNIKIKKNVFINQKGYMSQEFEIPIFLSPYE